MRDKNNGWVKRSLDPYGIYKKIPDRGWKVKNGATTELGNADVEPGFPDGFFISANGGCFIETKNGTVTAFPFSAWRPNQRQWYAEYALPKGIPVWLWIMVGSHVRAKKYPKLALLIPAPTLLQIEQETTDRKSLSYEYLEGLRLYRLEWMTGQDRWRIPDTHPFYKQMSLEEVANGQRTAG